MDCANFNSCTAAGVDGACVISCPDYIRGKRTPCATMRHINEAIAKVKTTSTTRRTPKQVKQSKKDDSIQVVKVFERLPKLFTATDYKQMSIQVFGSVVPLSKKVKKEHLKPDGKGHYINTYSKT